MECRICGFDYVELTKHHLIPKTCHKKMKSKKRFKSMELNRTVDICTNCHRQIHALIKESELATVYNTIERIVNYPQMAKYVSWIKRRGNTRRIKTKRSW